MQKMVALVALRCLPRGGVHFRKWFARNVVEIVRATQFRDTQSEASAPSVAHFAKMSNLRLDIATSVACYNHKQNYRLHQQLKRNVWFNYWGWHEKYLLPPKSKKRI